MNPGTAWTISSRRGSPEATGGCAAPPVPTQNSECRRNSRISLAFGVLSRDKPQTNILTARGKGQLLRWRGLAREAWPCPRRGVCDPAQAHWYGRAAERFHCPVVAPPPQAGASRDCARYTRRRVATGLRHRQRAWRCGKADCSCLFSSGYSSSRLPFWPTQSQLPTDLDRRVRAFFR